MVIDNRTVEAFVKRTGLIMCMALISGLGIANFAQADVTFTPPVEGVIVEGTPVPAMSREEMAIGGCQDQTDLVLSASSLALFETLFGRETDVTFSPEGLSSDQIVVETCGALAIVSVWPPSGYMGFGVYGVFPNSNFIKSLQLGVIPGEGAFFYF